MDRPSAPALADTTRPGTRAVPPVALCRIGIASIGIFSRLSVAQPVTHSCLAAQVAAERPRPRVSGRGLLWSRRFGRPPWSAPRREPGRGGQSGPRRRRMSIQGGCSARNEA